MKWGKRIDYQIVSFLDEYEILIRKFRNIPLFTNFHKSSDQPTEKI